MDLNSGSPQADSARRDLAAVDTAAWPERVLCPVEGRRPGELAVVVRQSVLNAIREHGQAHLDVEVCGVLVGGGYRDAAGPYLYLEGAIRGDHAAKKTTQVTFTAETWTHIYERLERDWPDARIIGWYHTHPGFGVFLSQMDRFIHESFFGSAEQTAVVYDPHAGETGLFLWRDAAPRRDTFLIEHDTAASPPEQHPDFRKPPPRERDDPIRLFLMLVLVGLLGWLAVGLPGIKQSPWKTPPRIDVEVNDELPGAGQFLPPR